MMKIKMKINKITMMMIDEEEDIEKEDHEKE